MSKRPQKKKPDHPSTYIWAAALSALAAFAAVYVTLAVSDNQTPAASSPSAASNSVTNGAAADAAPDDSARALATGKMATFVFKKTPADLTDVAFLTPDGTATNLSAFKGKVVLLNLWATWCAPCREEMPALAKLETELGSDKFQVVALSIDKSGVEGAKKFLDDIGATSLKPFADPSAKEGTRLGVIGMPTTLLINAEGKEIGRLIGPAEWDSADARRLIEKFIF
ncbi:TlpA disulfide reductase family protein [Hyphomicrobium sp. D-2]|uniref:TlpA family protein disulfide reductase n=1 Tax=Hyphomicrobium sp. D-2 TaxID=3041621 RepID=UPI002456C904|nr:TlpA disulfide reductase family protein [Hyphomicrobium sp. D-2]MDH4983586.1 TlpA disulfide reductase family protein [Hyphomicrobium sp. D-2]